MARSRIRGRFGVLASILALCVLASLLLYVRSRAMRICSVRIDSIVLQDSGQVAIEYSAITQSFAEIVEVLDGAKASAGWSANSWFGPESGSARILFHINQQHVDLDLATLEQRLLVQQDATYVVSPSMPLELYRFEEGGKLRTGFLTVE